MATRPGSLTTVAEMNTRANRKARDDWELFTHHRARLTAAICGLAPPAASGPPGATLCLLGAGNCNDVDLVELGTRFAEIHLVDIDGPGLDRARQRQPPELRPRLVSHPSVDLTGMLDKVDRWRGGKVPDPAALERAVADGVATIARQLPQGRMDVAVSCCLMSQLGWSIDTAFGQGDADPEAVNVTIATVPVHLHTLAGLCRPGGAALLASDIISSDYYPLDELPPDTDLTALAAELLPRRELVYTSANPLLVAHTLRRDRTLRAAFAPPVSLPPWLWTGRLGRTYLVYPQVLRRQ